MQIYCLTFNAVTRSYVFLYLYIRKYSKIYLKHNLKCSEFFKLFKNTISFKTNCSQRVKTEFPLSLQFHKSEICLVDKIIIIFNTILYKLKFVFCLPLNNELVKKLDKLFKKLSKQ